MSEHTNERSSVCRSHEHSVQSDSAEQERERAMMTEQEQTEPKFKVGQHVHVGGEFPGTVLYVFVSTTANVEHVYRVQMNDGQTVLVDVESALSSCDLAAELSDAMAAAKQAIADDPNAVDGILVWYPDDDDDHGPGCDGPLNCTCVDPAEAECARKLSEFDAVRETLDSVVDALQRAAADLSKFEIDDYADTNVIASSAALDEIGDAAVALLAVVAVMCESHPGNGEPIDQATTIAAQLRAGEPHHTMRAL